MPIYNLHCEKRENCSVNNSYQYEYDPFHRLIFICFQLLHRPLPQAQLRRDRGLPLPHDHLHLPGHLQGLPKAQGVHLIQGAVRVPGGRDLLGREHRGDGSL